MGLNAKDSPSSGPIEVARTSGETLNNKVNMQHDLLDLRINKMSLRFPFEKGLRAQTDLNYLNDIINMQKNTVSD